jgi:GNAT superfamily N-acetyltransferase
MAGNCPACSAVEPDVNVTVRRAAPGDGDGIARAWVSAGAYHAELDPVHFQRPSARGLAEDWDRRLESASDRALNLVAELDGAVIGWLHAHIEPPVANAAQQFVRELAITRLAVDAVVVDRVHWRHGAGSALLLAAEAWGREHGAEAVRLDTYARSPVSVPFYEAGMGYERRSIVFQKRL